MKAALKAKSKAVGRPRTHRTSEPDRKNYFNDWESDHPSLKVRFQPEQLKHVKSAIAALDPQPSVNAFLRDAAIEKADKILRRSSPIPIPAEAAIC